MLHLWSWEFQFQIKMVIISNIKSTFYPILPLACPNLKLRTQSPHREHRELRIFLETVA